ncbi:hypothetical protein E2C01_097554 [Portunus trituberculatus]|uniref:Uncharacterized protein n=1 Tax=Portunus trituberculatus TaxID=210409 RepID=A0A5B7K4Q8_PORTR|nr:hypothetical protein [Portunus trituberculatus]
MKNNVLAVHTCAKGSGSHADWQNTGPQNTCSQRRSGMTQDNADARRSSSPENRRVPEKGTVRAGGKEMTEVIGQTKEVDIFTPQQPVEDITLQLAA